jgi:uncharacterized protein YjgD (DUF1641 family)
MDANQAFELERFTAAARDSLTDEMVSRLSATVAEGVDLLDQINRSGVGRALPALSQLVANGDLDRLVALARTFGAAQDAMTDEMVSRLAETVAETVSIVDRMHRAGLDRLVGVMEQMVHLLEGAVGAMEAARRDVEAMPAARGGLGGMLDLLRDREGQESLRFFMAFAKEFRKHGG